MKISKKPTQAVQATCDTAPVAPEATPNTTAICQPTDIAAADPRAQARCYIQSAIGALTAIASEDVIAKDSIANLAVVLMDLQG